MYNFQYSIIASLYQPTQSKEVVQRFIDSIAHNDNLRHVELILVHDGPMLEILEDDVAPYSFPEDLTVSIYCTENRENVYGHTSRDYGLRFAKGRFCLVTNADNTYSPNLFQNLDLYVENEDVVYMGIVRMRGLHRIDNRHNYYDNPRKEECWTYLDGNPLVMGNVDCMNTVISNKLWKQYNFWNNLDFASDYYKYAEITANHPIKYIDVVIGDHY